MGTTDNAFIRVFDGGHHPSKKARRKSRASGVTVRRESIMVATESSLVSEVYAGVADQRPVALNREAPSKSTESLASDDAKTIRLDPPQMERNGPNLKPSVLTPPSVSTQPSVLAQPSVSTQPSVLAQASAAILSPTNSQIQEAEAETASPPLPADNQETRNDAQNDKRTAQVEENGERPHRETSRAEVKQAWESRQVARAIAGPNTALPERVHETVKPPSADVATKSDGFAPRARRAQTWHPQWEVDQFRWPEICVQLSQQASNGLAEIIRPVLSSAWRGENVVAVTSFDRDEGGSTVAMCLARMAASFRVPVALIDGDLENPTVGASLGMAYERGWNDTSLSMSLQEVAVSSLRDRVVVLPVNEHARDIDPSLAAKMLDELSRNFELVVIDAGPIFTAAYRWFEKPICEQIHGTLIVRDVRNTTSHQIDDVCTRLESAGISQLAIVENFRAEAA